ncbi:hypothetical protein [Rhodopseudomonas parapalustris]
MTSQTFQGTDDTNEHRRTIGILAESGASIFDWDLTQQAIQSGGCRIVFFTEFPQNSYRRRWSQMPARLAWRMLARIEDRVAKAVHLSFRAVDSIPLACAFESYFKEFPAAEIAKVIEANVDLLIRLGGRGIYRGSILDAARHGMISIHHGDNRLYRGGPPGFWEIMNGEARCGYIVQRLTRVLDGGEVLARGEIATARFAALNRVRLFKTADAALAAIVADFVRTGRLPEPEPPYEQLGPIYRMPSLVDLVRYVWRTWVSPSSVRRVCPGK